jgi:ppGpp synthetase/RelA/SpoT-type nucleotidyltranferase
VASTSSRTKSVRGIYEKPILQQGEQCCERHLLEIKDVVGIDLNCIRVT